MVSLMPMNGDVETHSTVQFTCNYDYPDTFYIYFKLSSLDGFPITAWGRKPGPIIKTEKGAFRTWSVHVELTACNVECHIVNYHGKELVKIVTSITPGLTDHSSDSFRPSCPSAHPSVICSKGERCLILSSVMLPSGHRRASLVKELLSSVVFQLVISLKISTYRQRSLVFPGIWCSVSASSSCAYRLGDVCVCIPDSIQYL